jgi:hypothetical protein
MKRLIGALIGALLIACAANAQSISQLPNVSLPLTGNELLLLDQPNAASPTGFSSRKGSTSLLGLPVNSSLSLDTQIGSTRGSILERGPSVWQIIPPGTLGLPWVSNGPGADPAYQAMSAAGLPAGVLSNALNSQTANYSIASTDCGKTIQAGTGSTGFFTVTLPAVTGFPATCVITVKNGDTGRGKALSGFPSDLNAILWPLQATKVGIVNGAWTTLVNPGRWKIPVGGVTFNLDNVNGNDANDGLATGAGNALASLNVFDGIVTDQLDTQGQIVTLLATNGQTYTAQNLNVAVAGGGTVNLNGNGATFTSTVGGTFALTVNATPTYGAGFGNVAAVVQNITITCSGGGGGLLITQGFVALGAASGATFGSCPGSAQIQVDSPLSRLLLQHNYNITGGAAWHLVAVGGGLIDWNSGLFTATLTGTPNYTNAFAFAEIGGQLVSFNVWSGSATGPRYLANTGGNIFTNGGGPNFFPGNALGSTATGGNYDTEWAGFTPVFTCGTATITSNSARSRTFGKTTWLQIEFTITALGTCTNTLTFTLPTTPNSVGTIPTIETVVNGALGMCRASIGSTTANCFTTSAAGVPLSNFVVNEHFVGSGVYENQ